MKTLTMIMVCLLVMVLPSSAANLRIQDSNALPDTIVTVPVVLEVPAGESVASLQFDILFDSVVIKAISGQTSLALVALSKSVSCTSTEGFVRCIVFGVNQNEIPDGTMFMNLAVTTTSAFVGLSLQPVGLVAAAPDATTVPLTSTTPGLLALGSGPCDIDGSGMVNVIDVQIVVNASINNGTCGPG